MSVNILSKPLDQRDHRKMAGHLAFRQKVAAMDYLQKSQLYAEIRQLTLDTAMSGAGGGAPIEAMGMSFTTSELSSLTTELLEDLNQEADATVTDYDAEMAAQEEAERAKGNIHQREVVRLEAAVRADPASNKLRSELAQTKQALANFDKITEDAYLKDKKSFENNQAHRASQLRTMGEFDKALEIERESFTDPAGFVLPGTSSTTGASYK